MAGVAKDALLFSYQVAAQDSPLAGSRLVVEELPILVFCSHCNGRQQADSAYTVCCAVCGTPASDVVQGRELSVSALEILE